MHCMIVTRYAEQFFLEVQFGQQLLFNDVLLSTSLPISIIFPSFLRSHDDKIVGRKLSHQSRVGKPSQETRILSFAIPPFFHSLPERLKSALLFFLSHLHRIIRGSITTIHHLFILFSTERVFIHYHREFFSFFLYFGGFPFFPIPIPKK